MSQSQTPLKPIRSTNANATSLVTLRTTYASVSTHVPFGNGTSTPYSAIASVQAKANVFDVAKYIVDKCGTMTHMKLQKLVYYAQAWGLVWDEKALFDDPIEAWINGPVVPSLFRQLKTAFNVKSENIPGNATVLNSEQKDTINAVLEFYGQKTSQYLSDLTHLEEPWKEARKGIPDSERGSREITHASMIEYYSGLA